MPNLSLFYHSAQNAYSIRCCKKNNKINKKLYHSAILNLESRCSSVVKWKYIILFFFIFLSLTLSVSHWLSFKARPSHSPHSFSHLTSLFLVQGLYWSWVWFMVTAWRSAWIDEDWWVSQWRLVGCQCRRWWVAQDHWWWAGCGVMLAALIWWRYGSNGFANLGFVVSPIWVLCGFCSGAWIDFYLLGSDGLDVAVI